MAIYKYFIEEAHALALIEKGILFLQPLSHFRNLEDSGVRGDRCDGVLSYAPSEGLEIKKEDGTVIVIENGQFTSSAKQNDIFVYCASKSLSAHLAEKFGNYCVEIPDPKMVVDRLRSRASASSKLDYNVIYAQPVMYRKPELQPGVNWALPEKLAFFKPEAFSWQNEFRIALGKRRAFEVENVVCKIEIGQKLETVTEPMQNPLELKIGRLDGLKLHPF